MKKTSMACLIAGALALPMGAYAQGGDDGSGPNDGKMNTTNPNIGKANSTTPDQPANRSAAGASSNRTMGSNSESTSPNRSAGGTVSDAALTAKVKTQLIKDRDVSAMNVNVDTANGVVTLKGNAKSRMEADKAASLARSVEGVKSVKNELVVGTASSSNTSRGSSTAADRPGAADRNASSGNAKGALDNKPTPPKENKNNGERGNSEKTN